VSYADATGASAIAIWHVGTSKVRRVKAPNDEFL
jgi:hypothetical protein